MFELERVWLGFREVFGGTGASRFDMWMIRRSMSSCYKNVSNNIRENPYSKTAEKGFCWLFFLFYVNMIKHVCSIEHLFFCSGPGEVFYICCMVADSFLMKDHTVSELNDQIPLESARSMAVKLSKKLCAFLLVCLSMERHHNIGHI